MLCYLSLISFPLLGPFWGIQNLRVKASQSSSRKTPLFDSVQPEPGGCSCVPVRLVFVMRSLLGFPS